MFAFLTLLQISSVTSFDCEYSSNVEYQIIGKAYRCDVNNLNISSIDGDVEKINGIHETEHSNANVLLLKIEQQRMPNIPKNLNIFFPNLEGLIIDSSHLEILGKADLRGFPKLRFLYIGHNRIEKLDEGLFEGTPNIEWLVFINNFTKRISHNILLPLSKLSFANFQRNTCVNKKASNQQEIELLKKEIEIKC